ncbi:MAG: hypothetical protein GC151_17735 [Betaproteobacteria bacterium]|nr:hypothetical protein [Betaproteobacteria bacterium]
MILHCSRKLAAKLTGVSPTPLEETSPLGSWHGHLFTMDRRQCVMFCHDATRFTLFLPGLRKEQFADLGGPWFRLLFVDTLVASGCPVAQIRKAELALGPMRFDTATDRSVQGSLRIAKFDLEAWLYEEPNVMDLDLLEVCLWLNKRPVTIRGKFLFPATAMQERLAVL